MSVEHVAPTILLPYEEKRNIVSYINSKEKRLVLSCLNDERSITSRINFICSNTLIGENIRLVLFKLMEWTGSIYEYSNVALRLLRQTPLFVGVWWCVHLSATNLGQKKLKKIAILS